MSLIVQNSTFNEKSNWYKIVRNINNNLNENINIYFNLKNSDGHNYMNKETTNTSIFFAGSKNEYNSNYGYQFITINSLDPNLGKINRNIKFNNSRFKYITSRMTPFNRKYKYNRDGYILILLNNIYGWFSNYYSKDIDIKFNQNNLYFNEKKYDGIYKDKHIIFNKALLLLIQKIRTFTNRKIIIRQHPKNRTVDFSSSEYFIDNKTNLNDLIDNCYCCFIQNTRLLFHLVNKGIPLFPLDFYTFNHFPEIYINLKKIESINKIILPNRLNFLKKYYMYIHFKDEIDSFNKFRNILKYYSISMATSC